MNQNEFEIFTLDEHTIDNLHDMLLEMWNAGELSRRCSFAGSTFKTWDALDAVAYELTYDFEGIPDHARAAYARAAQDSAALRRVRWRLVGVEW